MEYPEVVVLLVLAGSLALFVTELVPLGVTGLGIIAVLGLSGVLTPERAVAAFSSPVVLLVGSLYVVCASLVRTGVVGAVDRYLVHLGENSERRLLLVTTLGAAAISTLLNNTSVVVLMLPLLLGAASRLGVPPSRLLMPLSFAAILGGTMTLIGTSTNVLVADLAASEFRIGFLDFLPVGAVFVTIGMLYLWFVAPRLLPLRPTVSSVTKGRAFEYVTELRVRHTGPAVGSTPAELARRVGEKIRILQLVRGEEVLDRLAGDTVLEPDDILILRGTPETIVELRRDLRLELLAGGVEGPSDKAAHGTTFAEIVITPASELIGRTLKEVGLNRTFGVVAVAMQRRGSHLRHSIVDLPVQVGDVIMVQGSPEDVAGLRGQPGFLLLVGVEEDVVLRRRAPVAITILALFVLLAATGAADLSILALGAAVACLLTGCIRLRRAVTEMNWNVLGLLAGAVTLGVALYTTGLADRAADLMVGLARSYGPVAVLGAVYLVTAVATEFVTNSGAAALMVPIALATAAHLGYSPKPFVFAVAYAASASFATPIGYQTNAFIYGPGGYRFRDYVRVGLPLQILLWIVATLFIPVCFPFS
ncbi:MAG: SLC13 family permease [Planctomycetota bacterium]|jgi:di/tricarboxylate transporter